MARTSTQQPTMKDGWWMDGKWSGNSSLFGSGSLANNGG